jgi:hypothetical protein
MEKIDLKLSDNEPFQIVVLIRKAAVKVLEDYAEYPNMDSRDLRDVLEGLSLVESMYKDIIDQYKKKHWPEGL